MVSCRHQVLRDKSFRSSFRVRVTPFYFLLFLVGTGKLKSNVSCFTPHGNWVTN